MLTWNTLRGFARSRWGDGLTRITCCLWPNENKAEAQACRADGTLTEVRTVEYSPWLLKLVLARMVTIAPLKDIDFCQLTMDEAERVAIVRTKYTDPAGKTRVHTTKHNNT